MCVRQEVFSTENPVSHNFDLGRASRCNQRDAGWGPGGTNDTGHRLNLSPLC